MTLLKSFKTEIDPTLEQKQKIHQTIGTCRFVYNFYLSHNKEVYEAEKKFADTVATQQIVIVDGGHLNSESGYAWDRENTGVQCELSCSEPNHIFYFGF